MRNAHACVLVIAASLSFIYFKVSCITRLLYPVIYLFLVFMNAERLYIHYSDCGITEFHVLFRFLRNKFSASSDFFSVFTGVQRSYMYYNDCVITTFYASSYISSSELSLKNNKMHTKKLFTF